MRSIGWLVLLAVVLLAVQQRDSGLVAADKPTKANPRSARVTEKHAPKRDEVVDGYGPNATAARERALEHAQARLEKLLAERLNHAVKLSSKQFDPDTLVSQSVVQFLGEPEQTKEGAWVARCKVELTPDYLAEVLRVAREQRVQERHVLLARILAGLVALALVITGYLRLEDVTRGYATKMLRLGAAVLVALAVGLLLVIG